MLQFRCPRCQSMLRVPEDYGGSQCRCGKCGVLVDVPHLEGSLEELTVVVSDIFTAGHQPPTAKGAAAAAHREPPIEPAVGDPDSFQLGLANSEPAVPVAVPRNYYNFALAGFVLSLLGLILPFFVPSLLAVALAAWALHGNRPSGIITGRNLAIAGLVIGSIGFCESVLALFLWSNLLSALAGWLGL